MTHKTARTLPLGSNDLTPPTLLTYGACAALLGMSDRALRSMVSRGQVPGDCIVKIGRRMRFSAPAITAWISSMTGGAK